MSLAKLKALLESGEITQKQFDAMMKQLRIKD